MTTHAPLSTSACSDPNAVGNIRSFALLAATLTKSEVADRLGVCTKTIDNWAKDPALGFPQPLGGRESGAHGRWSSEEVTEWLRDGVVALAAERMNQLQSSRVASPESAEMMRVGENPLSPTLTKAQVATYFRVTPRTLSNWLRATQMAFPRPCNPAGHPRWVREDIVAWRGGALKSPEQSQAAVPAMSADVQPQVAAHIAEVSPSAATAEVSAMPPGDASTEQASEEDERSSSCGNPESDYTAEERIVQEPKARRQTKQQRLDRLAGKR